MTIPARPLYRHSDIEEALFADVFSGSLCRMEAVTVGIGCVECCRFSPFLCRGTFADRYRDKERCRKKKAILAGAQPLNSGHGTLLISLSNVHLDQTQPVNPCTAKTSRWKNATPVLKSRLGHAPSVVFNVDFQIAMRRVANRTDFRRLGSDGDRPAPAAFPDFHFVVSKTFVVFPLSGSLQQLSS